MLGRSLMSAIAALVLVSTASVAHAAETKDPNSMLVMRDFGKCVVNKSRSKARQLLGYAPYSMDERELLVAMPLLECLKREENIHQLKFDYKIIRGIIAERLFIAEFGSIEGKSKRKSEIPGIFSIAGAIESSGNSEEARLSIAMLKFTSCIVDQSPLDAAAVLQTPAGSVEEKAAIANLSSAMGMCAAEGLTFKIVRPQLRGFIAEAAYRAAVVAMPGQS